MKQYTTLQQVRCYSHLISSHFASSQPFVNSSHLIPPHLFSCLLSFSQIFSVLLTSSQLISTLLSHLIKCSHLFASTSVLLILSHFIISSDSFTSAHLNPCHLFLSFFASAHLVIYSSLCYSSTHSMFRLHHLFCSLLFSVGGIGREFQHPKPTCYNSILVFRAFLSVAHIWVCHRVVPEPPSKTL